MITKINKEIVTEILYFFASLKDAISNSSQLAVEHNTSVPSIDCPKSGPGPGGPRSGLDQTTNVQVQVQIWVDLDPNYKSRSSW